MSQRVSQYGTTSTDPWEGVREPSEAPPKQVQDEAGTDAGDDDSWREAEMSQAASLFTAAQGFATAPVPITLFYFLIVVETLQTIALPFAQQQKFSQQFDTVAGIVSFLFSLGSSFYGSTELLLLAIFVFLASTTCVCVTVLAWRAVENSRRQPASLISLTRKVSLLLSKVALLPVLYLSVITGTRSDLIVAVQPIMILAFIMCFVVSAFTEFLVVDRRVHEVGSASTGRVSFVFVLLRVVSLIMSTVLPYPSWCLLINALSLSTAAHFHWTVLPFHARWVNSVRLGSLVFASSLSAWLALWLIFGGGAEVPFGYFVFSCSVSTVGGACAPILVQRKIGCLWGRVLSKNAFGQYSIHPSTVNMEEGSAFLSSWIRSQSWFSETNVVLMMRFAPYHLFALHNSNSAAADGEDDRRSSATSSAPPSPPSARVHPEQAVDNTVLGSNNLLRFVDLMMHAQIDLHPDDASLYLHYGYFILSTLYEVNEVRGDPRRRMMLLVQEAERTKMSLDLTFFTAMLRSFSSAENGGDSLEVIQRSLLMAQWRLSLVRAAYVRLWKVLLNPHKTDASLEEALAIVENLECNCDAMYNGLLETYPRSPQVLRACASFFLSVKGDEKRAQELMETATRMEESSSSLSAKHMASSDQPEELCDNRGGWQDSTVLSPNDPTVSMSSLTSPSGLVVRSTRSIRSNSEMNGSEVALQAPPQMKKRSVHSAAGGKQNGSMSPTSPMRPNAFADDRETALSDAGRRSIGKSSNSFNTNSSEGGLSRSRIRNRDCKTLKNLSLTMLMTYIGVVVFLTILFAVSYSSITSYKEVNNLLLQTAQVQDHMQRMARLVRKAAREPDATIYIEALRGETGLVTSLMGKLASGLKNAHPAVADKWYRSPVYLELLPYAGHNVSYLMGTNLWKGYGEIMTFCDEFVSMISKEKQTGAQLLRIPSFFGIRQNSVASLRIAHNELLETYQEKEEAKQFTSAVVVQTIVATLLIGLPIAFISFLFFLFLRQFDEERHASFGLFETLPKSVVRDAIHVASEGNVCGLISGRISTAAEMESVTGNNERTAGAAVLDSGITSRVAAMSVSSTRNRLVKTTIFFFTAFALCMLGLYAMNISTYATVQYDAAEIHWSSRLHAQLLATLSSAYQRSLSLAVTGIDEAPKIQALLLETTNAYQSVRYGDASKNLPGISEGRDKLLKLLFSKTCDSPDVMCSSMESTFYAVVQSLRRYANDPNTTNAEPTLKTLTAIYENKLAGQMDSFIDDMTYGNFPKVDTAATICIVVFVVSVLLVSAMYFGAMRPQISQLENQRRRVDIVLLLAPTATIFKQDALRLYLVEGEPLIVKKSGGALGGSSANGGAHSLWHSALFDYSKDGLVEISENGFIVGMNRAALTMYGLVEQNAIGKPLSLLISSPEAAEKIIRQLMAAVKALATGGKDDAHSQSSGTRTTVFPPEESEAHRGNQGHIFFTSLFLTIVAETKGAKGSKPLCVLSIRDITDDRHKSQLLEEEKARSDQLLTNILPRSIATRLSNGDRNIADGYENVSVLFFDLVGFTSMSSKMPPQELVATLNDVFSGFDDIILQNGCEKIKTIGDAIMVASGLPEPRPDHGRALVQTGLDFIEHLKSVNQRRGLSLNCRIGINSGPVVAGVIGKMKFAYDLWSDTVNVASRMESTSLSGRIQVSRSAYELTYKFFDYEERPAVEVKGKGLMQCYLVIGPKQQSQ